MNILEALPDAAVLTGGIILLAAAILGPLIGHVRGKRIGRKAAHPDAYATRREQRKDTALFLSALIPSILIWLAVMAVSFIGLTGFARDMMRWDDISNMLVPLSLDGISVAFGAWAFVAVKRGRHPGRAKNIVMAAAAVSALLNFVHGQQVYSVWAGGYLAFLSVAGMAMFHELLEQFMAQADHLEVDNRMRQLPGFGMRWVLAFWSSFAAWRAWIVWPAPKVVEPTILNALHHWNQSLLARGKKARSFAIAYTDEDLKRFPDGLRKSSQKTSGSASRSVPEVPAVNGWNSSGAKGFGLPSQVNGLQKTPGPLSSIYPEAFPGSLPGSSGKTSRSTSRSEPEEVKLLRVIEAMRKDPGLKIAHVQKIANLGFDKAKPLHEAAKQFLSDEADLTGTKI